MNEDTVNEVGIKEKAVGKSPLEESHEEVEQESPAKVSRPVEKKKSGCGKCLGCFGIFVLVAVVVLGTAGFFGIRAIKNFTDQEDFGVETSVEGVNSLMSDLGIDVGVDYEELCFNCAPLTYTGEKSVTLSVTEEQASSWVSILNASSYGLRDFQMRFSEDQIEVTTYIGYQGVEYPIYAAGNVSRVSDKELDVVISDVKVGPLSIPAEYVSTGEEWLEGIGRNKLQEVDGLNVHDLQIKDGEVIFEGTVPEGVE